MKRFLALWLVIITSSWYLLPAYAARTFADGFYLELASALASAEPVTMCTWMRSTATTVGQGVMGIGTSAADDHRLEMNIEVTAVLQARARAVHPNTASAVSSTTVTQSVWQHGCAVFTSTTSRTVYLNGGNSGTNATSVAPTGLNRTWVGRMTGGAANLEFNGELGIAGFWTTTLSAAEIAALANGTHPRKIQPTALVACPQVRGDASPEVDECAARTWSVIGAPSKAATHPPARLFSPLFGA